MVPEFIQFLDVFIVVMKHKTDFLWERVQYGEQFFLDWIKVENLNTPFSEYYAAFLLKTFSFFLVLLS